MTHREDPLRIALLSYRSKPHCGGQGVYVRRLSAALRDLGHSVEVISGPPYPELEDGVALTRLPALDLYNDDAPFRWPRPGELRSWPDWVEALVGKTGGFGEPWAFSLRAARALRGRTDLDVVHDNQTLGYGLLRLVRAGLPLVATVHHPISVDRRIELANAGPLRGLSLRRWYGFVRMQARVARRLPRIVTVSENSARDISTDFRVPAERLTVVPVGVDAEVFSAAGSGGVPRRPDSLVTVASADVPLKGLDVLLEAVAKLRTERPEVTLTVIGRPRPDSPTLGRIDELGVTDAVRFVSGLTDAELAAELAAAAVAVVPSRYEGFSLPAIEAMACGTPLVACATGALPEVVGADGDAARLVPPGDAAAMAAVLDELLGDPAQRARLGAAGRERVTARFDWHAVAVATVHAYREAIAALAHADRAPAGWGSAGRGPEHPAAALEALRADVGEPADPVTDPPGPAALPAAARC